MNRKLSIFWSKGFIIGLIILLLNDHFLKSTFHNWFTGKISDVAGLFIFPIFFAVILPKYKKHIYWITALGFIVWKSPFSTGLIDFINASNIIYLKRVIDWTDLLALFILPASLFYSNQYKEKTFRLSPLPVIIITSFAFIATSRSSQHVAWYNYGFVYSKAELIQRLNIIAKEDKQLPISEHVENSNYHEVNGIDSVFYHISGYREFRDTFYTEFKKIDTVRVYQIPNKDTIYISKNRLQYNLDVQKYFKEKEKDYCSSVVATIDIRGNESGSSLSVLGFDTRNCSGIFEKKDVSKEMDKLQKKLEKRLKKKK